MEQMQGLMHLELSGCNDFTEAGLWSSLNARLTSLSVSDCINVADDAIAAISQLLPNLSELSLQAYHVTDTAMAYFTAKQVRKDGRRKEYIRFSIKFLSRLLTIRPLAIPANPLEGHRGLKLTSADVETSKLNCRQFSY